MKLSTLQENVQGFVHPDYGRVQRDGPAYTATRVFTHRGLKLCLMMYRKLNRLDQTARLLRDGIDFLLRRYHGYAIKEQYRAHYRDCDLGPKDKIDFEHVIPLANIIALLIQDKITIDLAMHPPTCLLSRRHHAQLKRLGLADRTPDVWNFWQRYEKLGVRIETHLGEPVDMQSWNLGTHCTHFNIN